MSLDLLQRIGKEKFIIEMNKSHGIMELCRNLNAGYRYVLLALSKLGVLEEYKKRTLEYQKIHSKEKFNKTLEYRTYDKTNKIYRIDAKKWCQLFFDGKVYSTHTKLIKTNLFNAGYKENKCECCGITQWNNKEISLQIHHIDGNRKNNRLENLQILCPNCHSQTENYGSKNATKKEIKKKEKIIKKKQIKMLTFNGKTLSISEWSDLLGIPKNTIRHRIDAGKSIEEVLKVK